MAHGARRLLCRVSFLTLCVLPTLALSGWIINERAIQGAASPAVELQAKSLAEAELSRRLGLTVTLEKIAFPQTGFTVLEGVAIFDPETRQRLAFVPTLEMAQHDRGLVLVATRPEIDADRWSALWEALHERLLRERGEPIVPARLTARQVVLASQRPGRSPTLTDVEVQWEPGKFAADFRIAGVEMSHAAQFRATRDRASVPPATRWELHTGEAELPCALFADYAPWVVPLGERCQFVGSLWAKDAGDGWQGELTGRFSDIDLDRLVSDRFPHKLTGRANAVVSRVQFSGGRLRAAAGFLESGSGTISRGLLEAAARDLELPCTQEFADAVKPLTRYAQLKFGFTLDDAGLQLSGKCDPEGTLLVLEGDPQARMTDHYPQVLPAVALVRALAPASELQVSASREADALLRVLPLPPLKRPEPARGTPPQAHVRFSDETATSRP